MTHVQSRSGGSSRQDERTADRRAEALQALTEALGGGLRTDAAHRHLYATDASIYAERPMGVAFPRSAADLDALVRFARQTRTPLIPRGAGTSLAGQVVGDGLVVDIGRHLNRIIGLDTAAREVVVEPGVIQSELNRYLAPHGLLFGPDTSTANRAMIGGMLGNNSCGSHSIRYGTTRDHVRGLNVLLSDGVALELGPLSHAEVAAQIASGSRLGGILGGLRDIVSAHGALIRARYPGPELVRRNAGYALDRLVGTSLVDPDGPPVNLAQLLCGSEGTLAIVTRARLNVEPRPAASGVIVAHFDSMPAALRATIVAIELNPSAVELVDRPILELTRGQLQQRHNRFFLQGDPAVILLVEFFADSEEALAAQKRVAAERLEASGSYACVDIPADKVSRVWSLRKAGLGLLMGIPGDKKPVAFVEDTAVPVARLPEYIDRFEDIMARYDTDCVYYGHASVGELHMRPVLDLKTPQGVRRLTRILAEVAELVAELGGTLSGEHGDGRVRSPYLEETFGRELIRAFADVKRLFDPAGVLNPGKIVDPEPVSADLRTQTARSTPDIGTVMRFEGDGDLVRHVERCNGAGVCRKLATAGGTMCPSYMVTRDEMHSTRGRANLFRQLLYAGEPAAAMESDDLYAAMDLCLQCKGCKAECPASVDLAKVKSEFLQGYWTARGLPLRVWLVGHIATLYALARPAPWAINWVMKQRWLGRWMRSLLGFDRDVPLPPLANQSLRRWHRKRPPGPALDGASDDRVVALFVDEFTNLMDVDVGRCAIELLEALGYRVLLPKHKDSGRPLISKGLLRAAAKRARYNVSALRPLASRGIPIVGLEPSALLTLVDEYPDLVDADQRDDARLVADRVLLLEDFLVREAESRDLGEYFDREPRRIAVHGHCHQKALVGTEGTLGALRLAPGHDVSLIEAGCCGMAGSFGYEHRELSTRVGELLLFPAVRELAADSLIAAPGFSCRHQVELGTGRKVRHPVEILWDALRAHR